MANSLTDLMGALCEIRDMDNDLLMVGKIDKIEEHYVQVTDKNSQSLRVEYGTPIKAQIYSVSDDFAFIEGTAYLCDENFLRISDIDFIATEERRNFFRIDVNEPVNACGSASKDIADRLYIPWKEAYVGNISLSGILLHTKEDLEVGSYVMVQLPQLKNKKNKGYVYHIIRKEEKKKVRKSQNDKDKDVRFFSYGCELVNDATNRNTDELCSYIFERQRKIMGKMKDKP